MQKRTRRRFAIGLLLVVATACALSLVLAAFPGARSATTHGAARSLRTIVGVPNLDRAPAVERPEFELVPQPRTPDRDGAVSYVLLAGFDRGRKRLPGRTDALVVVAFRHRDGKVAAFNLPRDLWVDIPDKGPGRINAVVRIGELRGEGQGFPLLRRVIEDEFGLRIDRHVAVDMAGLVEIVDALGGIEVDVPCPLKDCFWPPGERTTCEMLDVAAGRQRLDGRTALLYARSRHGRGDKDRQKRQQAVLLGFAREVERAGLRGLPRLWSLAEAHVETDLDARSAVYYGSFALELAPSEVNGLSLHSLLRKHVTEDRKHVVVLDRERFDEHLDDLFRSKLPANVPRRRCPDADVALRGR